jgi:hypothetical protein
MRGSVEKDAGLQTCAMAVASSTSGLAGSSAPAFLGHDKGRVRLLELRRIHSGKNRGAWRSGSTAFSSSSPQMEIEVFSPSPLLQAMGWFWVLWKDKVVVREPNGDE